jgi:geranylgeranyl pyrophosphate synthase
MFDEIQALKFMEEIRTNLISSLDDGLLLLVEEAIGGLKSDIDLKSKGSPWPLLPLLVSEATCGDYDRALPGAVAIQLFKTAAEVFDDIEDADSSDSIAAKYGLAIATNVATTLLVLAERAIAGLSAKGVKNSLVVRILDLANRYYLVACSGQHLDISDAPGITPSEETYLKIASMKSATTLECACHVGALVANSREELINLFKKFGHNLGMASQIANDINGIISTRDILRRKKTLPVVYALTNLEIEERDYLKTDFIVKPERVPDCERIRELLFKSGAIYYATLKMGVYKQQALDNLCEIEKTGINVQQLMPFLK